MKDIRETGGNSQHKEWEAKKQRLERATLIENLKQRLEPAELIENLKQRLEQDKIQRVKAMFEQNKEINMETQYVH